VLTFARQGLGLAYVAESEARADLASGRLRPVLQDYLRPSAGAFLYFPERMQTQPKLRAFIDLLRRHASSRPA
jgi:DNA-binding transcriptional LysR family regulator